MASTHVRREVLLMHRAVPALAPRHPVLCLERLVPEMIQPVIQDGARTDEVLRALTEGEVWEAPTWEHRVVLRRCLREPLTLQDVLPTAIGTVEAYRGTVVSSAGPLFLESAVPCAARGREATNTDDGKDSAIDVEPEGLDREETRRVIAKLIAEFESKSGIDLRCVLEDVDQLLCGSWEPGSFIGAPTVTRIIEATTLQCIRVYEGRDTCDAAGQNAVEVADARAEDVRLREQAEAAKGAAEEARRRHQAEEALEQRHQQLIDPSTVDAVEPTLSTRRAQWPYFFDVACLRCLSEAGQTQRTAVLHLVAALQDDEVDSLEAHLWDG